MQKNKNGKYDVLNLTKQTWFEVDEEWFDGINLNPVREVMFRREHTDQVLEVVYNNNKSSFYKVNMSGQWIKDY